MQATIKMTRNGQVSIPHEIRKVLGLNPGDYVTIDVIGKEKMKDEVKQGNEIPCSA